MRIDIKPLSVNEAWQGRRYKTKKYNKYINEVSAQLLPFKVPDGDLELVISFGLSNRASDIDNPLKCFIDCLQKKYDFDDRRIYKLSVEKIITKKGHEFIEWEMMPYESER